MTDLDSDQGDRLVVLVLNDALVEALAALEHEQWMAWAMNIMQTEPGLSSARLRRWQSLMLPFAMLPDEMKEQDRIWARRVLEVIDG